MRKAIVVGSGAGGAAAAAELARTCEVVVLEAGGPFEPMKANLRVFEPFRRAGLLFDERMIQPFFPQMKVEKTLDREMVLVTGEGLGGTTTLATGNAIRCDGALRELGIDLDEQFAELDGEVPRSTDHRAGWNEATERLFAAFEAQGLAPAPMPKMLRPEKCRTCGMCVLGCKYGAKWDVRELLDAAAASCDGRLSVVMGARVERVSGGDSGPRVAYRRSGRLETMEADLVVLAAGGQGTPPILRRSGVALEPRFFVDPVLCVCAPMPGCNLHRQLPMPFASQRDGFILSPYFDWLSFYFNRGWRRDAGDIASVMIKLADSCAGTYEPRRADKPLTADDRAVLDRAVEEATGILLACGARREDVFLGTLNAGHPGGMLPLGADDADDLHPDRLPEKVYVADATLLPASLGNPPILTVMALAKKVARAAVRDLR